MRPIDADAAKKDFGEHFGDVQDAICAQQIIDRQPTIDPKDLRLLGKNITSMHPSDEFVCSICGVVIQDMVIVIQDMVRYDPKNELYYEYEPKFCPNCGAKMLEEVLNA